MSETNHSSRNQHHDHGAVFNVIPGSESIIPMIKQFRDMAPDAKGQDQDGAEIENSPSHVCWMPFWHAYMKTI